MFVFSIYSVHAFIECRYNKNITGGHFIFYSIPYPENTVNFICGLLAIYEIRPQLDFWMWLVSHRYVIFIFKS